jgi:hypothetical protein
MNFKTLASSRIFLQFLFYSTRWRKEGGIIWRVLSNSLKGKFYLFSMLLHCTYSFYKFLRYIHVFGNFQLPIGRCIFAYDRRAGVKTNKMTGKQSENRLPGNIFRASN